MNQINKNRFLQKQISLKTKKININLHFHFRKKIKLAEKSYETVRDRNLGRYACQLIHNQEKKFAKITRQSPKLMKNHLRKIIMLQIKLNQITMLSKIEAYEQNSQKEEILRLEVEIQKKINFEMEIPRLYNYIKDSTKRVLLKSFQLFIYKLILGKNIDELFSLYNFTCSLKTILHFMNQDIRQLKYPHSKGFINQVRQSYLVLTQKHQARDFMIGIPFNENYIQIIDF
ncbi:unnamed protein product [Paramecium pentaurelia]|uniref:Uncharacterized protein n=1 Tax=Paramecium pentaurelia TaxID=43138 RepID=A0A8S1V7R5_9CILI|nr:unnamed protein product [Paramecium pentaurelia]